VSVTTIFLKLTDLKEVHPPLKMKSLSNCFITLNNLEETMVYQEEKDRLPQLNKFLNKDNKTK
jgi:hypothetical protein